MFSSLAAKPRPSRTEFFFSFCFFFTVDTWQPRLRVGRISTDVIHIFFLSSDKKKEETHTAAPQGKQTNQIRKYAVRCHVLFFFCFFSKQIFPFSGFLMIFKSDRRQRCFGEREQKEKQRMTQKWEEKTSKTEPESCTGKKKTLSNVCNALSLSLSLSLYFFLSSFLSLLS